MELSNLTTFYNFSLSSAFTIRFHSFFFLSFFYPFSVSWQTFQTFQHVLILYSLFTFTLHLPLPPSTFHFRVSSPVSLYLTALSSRPSTSGGLFSPLIVSSPYFLLVSLLLLFLPPLFLLRTLPHFSSLSS